MKSEILHEKNEFKNVRELIEWAAKTYEGRNFLSYRNALKEDAIRVTFEEFCADVRALASEFIKLGYAGKTFVIVGKFSYEWALSYYATLSTGSILVPLDKDWGAAELAKTAGKADASILLCDSDLAEKAEFIRSEVTLETEPILLCGRGSGKGLDELVTAGRTTYAENPDAYHNAPIDPDKLALMVFTSGTTGEGKGVMLCQRNFLSDLSDVIPFVYFSNKTVGVLPPHHTYGSSVMLIGHAMIGSEIYISAGIRYVQKELQMENPGHLVLVPLYLETFYRKIQANIKAQGKEKLIATLIKVSNFLLKFKIDLRSKLFAKIRAAFGGEVKMIISGGAPINSEIIDFFEAMGISTLNGYGITECAPIISVNRTRRNIKGSVGPVLPIEEVKIDQPNEAGEGEIWVKGPNVMLGYYKNEEATRDAFSEDGFFKTGDYGRLDGDVITITGRKKNLIILSNGKNVYPEEIESDLIATPGVLEIIVYEGKSRRGLEHNAIVAEIFTDKEYMEKNGIEDVRAYLMKYIDAYNKTAVPYKKIAILKIRDEEFPKNTLRKILRFKLDMSID